MKILKCETCGEYYEENKAHKCDGPKYEYCWICDIYNKVGIVHHCIPGRREEAK